MRSDDKKALEEQRNSYLVELRSINGRIQAGGKVSDADKERFAFIEDEVKTIQSTLAKQHEAELTEIRSAGGAGYQPVGHGEADRLSPMLAAFAAAGWEVGKPAVEIPFASVKEFRSLTMSASADNVAPDRNTNPVPLGYDERYAYPAFNQVAVDRTVTSVPVLRQTARSLASTANVTRAIDAVTAKPETSSTIDLVTVSMKQLATIQTGVPNIYASNPAVASVIENDLKAAISDALDALVNTAFAASGFQAPGTDPLLLSIRKCMTTIMAAGYNPDTVVLTPANAEALDTLQTVGTEKLWVFAAGGLAPRTLFGLQTRISKTVPAPVVVDSQAFGKLYTGPLALASFEAGAGTTNTQNVRLELNAAFGTERQPAAVRIAAS